MKRGREAPPRSVGPCKMSIRIKKEREREEDDEQAGGRGEKKSRGNNEIRDGGAREWESKGLQKLKR